MNKRNWVTVFSTSFYYKKGHSNTSDIHEAYIFEDKTEDEIKEIGHNMFRGIKGMWKMQIYEDALIEYDKRTYVDPSTKNLRFGRYIDIKDAIVLSATGITVCCKYKNDTTIYNKDNFPKEFGIDIIANATWRVIEEC